MNPETSTDLLRLSEIYQKKSPTEDEIAEALLIIGRLLQHIEAMYTALDMYQDHFWTKQSGEIK